jgi:hypothetical protein
MRLRTVSIGELPARAEKQSVHHHDAGGRRDRSADQYAVEAVDDGREAILAGEDAELGDARDPQLVGRVRPKVVLPAPIAQQVGRDRRDLPSRRSCSGGESTTLSWTEI